MRKSAELAWSRSRCRASHGVPSRGLATMAEADHRLRRLGNRMPFTSPLPMAAPDGGPSDSASAGRMARPWSVGTAGPDAAAAGRTAAVDGADDRQDLQGTLHGMPLSQAIAALVWAAHAWSGAWRPGGTRPVSRAVPERHVGRRAGGPP